ncbi:helix-turn-helix domain-containing protein [Vibrio sp. HN007]|uniref:helix-turn-helix domain-containing protein n=1 Tax=Vibrio iocasae TaxID=3098914 RepID=UPI0035D47012
MSVFSEQLKYLRKKNKLTQKECSQFLSDSREELLNVDYVSISRWEKESVRPSLKKQIMIIRLLGGDVEALLAENFQDSKHQQVIERWAAKKYDTINLMLAFQKGPTSTHECTLEQAKDESDAAFVVERMKRANEILELSESNHNSLYGDYLLNEYRAISFCRDEQGLIGYSIDLKFDKDLLPAILKRVDPDHIPATAIDKTKKLILYSYARMFVHSSAFKKLTQNYIQKIIDTPSIQKAVVRVMDQDLYKLLSQLGFEVLTTYNNSPVKLIEIGNKKYSTVLLGINIEELLSSMNVLGYIFCPNSK